jgi:hypothetical protein
MKRTEQFGALRLLTLKFFEEKTMAKLKDKQTSTSVPD